MAQDYKEYKGMQVRVGHYVIKTDAYNWIVDEMKPKDPNHRLSTDNGKTESLVDTRFYGSFEAMWNALLEKETKRQFERSGLEKVYSTALKNLFDMIKEAETANAR